MGKRNDGQSSNHTDCSSDSLENSAKVKATLLQLLETLLKEIERKKGIVTHEYLQ